MDINTEIDNIADKMEKSVEADKITLETIRNTIKTLGVEGLKKAAPNLTDSQKLMLKSVLDGMARDRKVTTEPASNTTKGGDERYNTNDKAPYDEQDEKIAKEAEKKDQQTPKNQGGGAPVEGWEGQIIKSQQGEGSRGGKVIGHTKSGKPIYENHDHESHASFDSNDHKDARDSHDEAAMNHFDSDNDKMDFHNAQSSAHAKKQHANPNQKPKAPKKEVAAKKEPESQKDEGKDRQWTDEEKQAYDRQSREDNRNTDLKRIKAADKFLGKSEDVEKGGPNSGRKPMTPGLEGVESAANLAARAKDATEIQAKFKEQAAEKPAEKKDNKEEKKEMTPETIAKAKANFKNVVERMQERKMDKADCCKALAKSLGSTEEAVGKVWDALVKGDILPEKGNPEGKQSEPAEIMKNGKEPAKKEPMSGKAHNLADEGEQPPKLEKSESFWHVEEEVYLAKSAGNPFAERTIKPNAHYNLDQYIELTMASQSARLAKSTFDYSNDDEVLVKSMDPAAMDTNAVVNANAKKQSQAKKDDKDEIKDIKINEKLTRIEDHAGPKMPMLKSEEEPKEAAKQDKLPEVMKKKKPSTMEDMIEKGLDMDQTQLDAAQAIKKSKTQGAFIVSSFSDAELDETITPKDTWK